MCEHITDDLVSAKQAEPVFTAYLRYLAHSTVKPLASHNSTALADSLSLKAIVAPWTDRHIAHHTLIVKRKLNF